MLENRTIKIKLMVNYKFIFYKVLIVLSLFVCCKLDFVDTDLLVKNNKVTTIKVVGFGYIGKSKHFDFKYFNEKDTITSNINVFGFNNHIQIGDEYYILYEVNGDDWNNLQNENNELIPVNEYWKEIIENKRYTLKKTKNNDVIIYPTIDSLNKEN